MPEVTKTEAKILTQASKAKRIIAGALLAMMFIVVAVGTVELVIVMARAIVTSIGAASFDGSEFLLSEQSLYTIFGLFLNVLIAVELIETVEVYFREHSLHAETVILVAIIAVSRKAILLDLSAYDAFTIIALAALLVGLGITYYLVKQRSGHPAELEGGSE